MTLRTRLPAQGSRAFEWVVDPWGQLLFGRGDGENQIAGYWFDAQRSTLSSFNTEALGYPQVMVKAQ